MVVKQLLLVTAVSLHTALIAQCDEMPSSLPAQSAADSQRYKAWDVEGEVCPTWFLPVRSGSNSVSCECGSSLQGIVRCNHRTNSTQLLSTYCMTATYSNSNSATEDNHDQVVGQCPYNHYSDVTFHYVPLPPAVCQINDYTCGMLNRTGLLCAHCKDGLGPVVLSYQLQCLECLDSAYGWLLYIVLACFPTTIFFLCMLIFQVRASSPPLNIIVFASQILSVASKNISNTDGTEQRVLKLISFTIAGFWNLDFFRYVIPPFCVSSRLTSTHVLALDYIVAVYPLVLIAAVYVIIELHDRNCRILTYVSKLVSWCFAPCKGLKICVQVRRWDPKSTIIHAFSTFLLLSYSKLLYVSFNLLASTKLYDVNGTETTPAVLYYDASIQYLSSAHRPFACLAILVLSTLIAFPPLLLLLYPTRLFQTCLGHCRVQWHPLHAFVDTFQGYYKNGTNGTRDYRSFSSLYLILRILFLTTNHLDIHYLWIVGIVCPGIASLLFALLRPYEYNWYNVLDTVFFAFVALYGFWILYSDTTTIITVPYGLLYAVSTIGVLYVIFYISYKILQCLGLLHKCQQKVRSLRECLAFGNTQGYNTVNERELPHRLENPEEYQPLLP